MENPKPNDPRYKHRHYLLFSGSEHEICLHLSPGCTLRTAANYPFFENLNMEDLAAFSRTGRNTFLVASEGGDLCFKPYAENQGFFRVYTDEDEGCEEPGYEIRPQRRHYPAIDLFTVSFYPQLFLPPAYETTDRAQFPPKDDFLALSSGLTLHMEDAGAWDHPNRLPRSFSVGMSVQSHHSLVLDCTAWAPPA